MVISNDKKTDGNFLPAEQSKGISNDANQDFINDFLQAGVPWNSNAGNKNSFLPSSGNGRVGVQARRQEAQSSSAVNFGRRR